jgi:PAS domain S-box-containing protein
MIGLGLYSRRFRHNPMVLPYQVLMYTAGLWAVNYAADLAVTELAPKVFIMETRFIVSPYVTLAEIWLVLVYLGKESWVRRWWTYPLTGFMVVTTLLALTSTMHTLFRYDYHIVMVGDTATLAFTNGPWYLLYIAVTYTLLLTVLGLLLVVNRPRQPYFLFQRAVFITALLLPVVPSIMYELHLGPVPGINFTTIFFWVPAVLYIWVLYPGKFFEIVPVARDRVIEGMTSPLLILDARRRVVDMNPAACTLLGTTARDAYGKPADQVFSPLPGLFTFCCMKDPGHVELVAGGGEHVYLVEMDTIPSRSGGPETSIIKLQDITARKRAENALRESEERYRTLVDQLPDYILVHRDGSILYINSTAATQLGYGREELLGRHVSTFIRPGYRDVVERAIEGRAAGEEIGKYGIEVMTKDGENRMLLVTGARIIYEGAPATLNVLTDITDLKRAEVSVRAANAKLNLLTSITRHDVNNQLTVMQGYIGLARDQAGTAQPISSYLEKADDAGGKISRMIAFTKGYQQFGVQAPVWHEVQPLVSSAAEGVMSGTLAVENRVPPGISVYADPLIAQVLGNLLENAARHGEKVTRVVFSAEDKGDHLEVICEDDGVGVPPDEKERIFGHGYGKNTGLGLFLAREILGITGITIHESGVPGAGARFVITVPKEAYHTKVPAATLPS